MFALLIKGISDIDQEKFWHFFHTEERVQNVYCISRPGGIYWDIWDLPQSFLQKSSFSKKLFLCIAQRWKVDISCPALCLTTGQERTAQILRAWHFYDLYLPGMSSHLSSLAAAVNQD
jgi:hypothetical protein